MHAHVQGTTSAAAVKAKQRATCRTQQSPPVSQNDDAVSGRGLTCDQVLGREGIALHQRQCDAVQLLRTNKRWERRGSECMGKGMEMGMEMGKHISIHSPVAPHLESSELSVWPVGKAHHVRVFRDRASQRSLELGAGR